MGRLEKVHSGTDAGDDLTAEIDQIDRLLARLRRTADQVALGFSIQSAESTLSHRWSRFTPTGDAAADRATLAQFEQQAISLLRKAQQQRRDSSARRTAGTAAMIIGR